VGKCEGRSPLGKLGYRLRIILKIISKIVDEINVTQDKDEGRDL
jgi:hypothetical protein